MLDDVLDAVVSHIVRDPTKMRDYSPQDKAAVLHHHHLAVIHHQALLADFPELNARNLQHALEARRQLRAVVKTPQHFEECWVERQFYGVSYSRFCAIARPSYCTPYVSSQHSKSLEALTEVVITPIRRAHSEDLPAPRICIPLDSPPVTPSPSRTASPERASSPTPSDTSSDASSVRSTKRPRKRCRLPLAVLEKIGVANMTSSQQNRYATLVLKSADYLKKVYDNLETELADLPADKVSSRGVIHLRADVRCLHLPPSRHFILQIVHAEKPTHQLSGIVGAPRPVPMAKRKGIVRDPLQPNLLTLWVPHMPNRKTFEYFIKVELQMLYLFDVETLYVPLQPDPIFPLTPAEMVGLIQTYHDCHIHFIWQYTEKNAPVCTYPPNYAFPVLKQETKPDEPVTQLVAAESKPTLNSLPPGAVPIVVRPLPGPKQTYIPPAPPAATTTIRADGTSTTRVKDPEQVMDEHLREILERVPALRPEDRDNARYLDIDNPDAGGNVIRTSQAAQVLRKFGAAYFSGLIQDYDLPTRFDLPFDGIVTGLSGNVVTGPLYTEKEFSFSRNLIQFPENTPQIDVLIKKLANEKDPKYKEVHHECAAYMRNARADLPRTAVVNVLEGTYACGKTYHLMKEIRAKHEMPGDAKRPTDFFVAAPSSALAAEYISKGFPAASWSRALCTVALYHSQGKPLHLYVDEAYLMDQALFPFFSFFSASMHIIGDPAQMQHGNKDNVSTFPLLENMLQGTPNRITISRTAPLDIVASLNLTAKVSSTTRSRFLNSVKQVKVGSIAAMPRVCTLSGPNACRFKHDHTYGAVFDTAHQQATGLPTVASIQGTRSKVFRLFLTAAAKPLVAGVHGQKLVAITRHTKTLELYYGSGFVDPAFHLLGIKTFTFDGKRFELTGLLSSKRQAKEIKVTPAPQPQKPRRGFKNDNSLSVGVRTFYQTPIGRLDVLRSDFAPSDNKFDASKMPRPQVTALTPLMDLDTTGFLGRLQATATPEEDFRLRYRTRRRPPTHASGVAVAWSRPKKPVVLKVPLAYETNAAHHSRPIVPLTTVGDKEVVDSDPSYLPRSVYAHSACPTVANRILQKIAPTSAPVAAPMQKIKIDYMRMPRQGREIKIKPNFDMPKEPNNMIVQCASLFGIRQLTNWDHNVATATERYGVVKPNKMSTTEAREFAEMLFQGVAKFVHLSALRPPTDAEFAACRAQALIRAAARPGQRDHAIYGESTAPFAIKCFNKNQMKSGIKPNAWLNPQQDENGLYIKGGQMVSAQSKEVNQIVAPYVAWTERCVFAAMYPGVFPGYGHSPRALRDKIAKHTKKFSGEHYETRSCDVSEQDTTKSLATDIYMRNIYRLCGVPDHVIDVVEAPNRDWMMKTSNVQVGVKYQFQSGRADTLFSNTMHTMGLIGFSFEIEDLQLALFQGDDSMIRAKNLRKTPAFYPKLKVNSHIVGDFVGFLVSDHDLHLDIPRMAAKTLSRDIPDLERRLVLAQAMRDLLSLLRDMHDQHMNVVICAYKYGMLQGDIEQLLAYLYAFSRDDFLLPDYRLGGPKKFDHPRAPAPDLAPDADVYALPRTSNLVQANLYQLHPEKDEDVFTGGDLSLEADHDVFDRLIIPSRIETQKKTPAKLRHLRQIKQNMLVSIIPTHFHFEGSSLPY
ncbi:RNA-dependent RNA polymerase [Freshwater macrophyte associated hepe-like virus 1]|nr:RNA-dependent RNA polymerase [Freshwater macrophyte associated hepe-like virus 1]